MDHYPDSKYFFFGQSPSSKYFFGATIFRVSGFYGFRVSGFQGLLPSSFNLDQHSDHDRFFENPLLIRIHHRAFHQNCKIHVYRLWALDLQVPASTWVTYLTPSSYFGLINFFIKKIKYRIRLSLIKYICFLIYKLSCELQFSTCLKRACQFKKLIKKF